MPYNPNQPQPKVTDADIQAYADKLVDKAGDLEQLLVKLNNPQQAQLPATISQPQSTELTSAQSTELTKSEPEKPKESTLQKKLETIAGFLLPLGCFSAIIGGIVTCVTIFSRMDYLESEGSMTEIFRGEINGYQVLYEETTKFYKNRMTLRKDKTTFFFEDEYNNTSISRKDFEEDELEKVTIEENGKTTTYEPAKVDNPLTIPIIRSSNQLYNEMRQEIIKRKLKEAPSPFNPNPNQ